MTVASAFNTPVESGLRVLILLTAANPRAVGLNTLVLWDHALLHSADLGGPPSAHPALPLRATQLSVKRGDLDGGLRVMMRAGLVELVVDVNGLQYRATETGPRYLDLLQADYVGLLRTRAAWVVDSLGGIEDESELRALMTQAVGRWSADFSGDFEQAGGEL